MNVAILTRVSKESQSFTRQVNDLRLYANSMGYNIIEEFNEKVSGASKNDTREALQNLFDQILITNIDKVLVWELSRLGRNTLEVLKSLEYFHSNGVSLYVLNNNLESLNKDGTVNSIAQMMMTLLAEFARTERETTMQRLRSGYTKYVKSGGKVGRNKGDTLSNNQMLDKHSDIVKYLLKERSVRECLVLK